MMSFTYCKLGDSKMNLKIQINVDDKLFCFSKTETQNRRCSRTETRGISKRFYICKITQK